MLSLYNILAWGVSSCEIAHVLTRCCRCTIFLHGVCHLVILVAPTFPGKKALLAHVKVEALQAPVSESKDGVLFADVTFCLVESALSRSEPVKYRKPDHALRLLLHPVEKMKRLDEAGVSSFF